MGIIGQAVTQPLPTVNEPGPTYATDIIALMTEYNTRLATLIDSSSIQLTTGDVIHAARTKLLGPALAKGSSGATWTPAAGAASAYWAATGAADLVEWNLHLDTNQRFTGASVTARNQGTAWTAKIWLNTVGTASRTQIGGTLTSGTVSGTIETLPFTGVSATTATGTQYISIEWTSGIAAARAIAIQYTYDRVVAT